MVLLLTDRFHFSVVVYSRNLTTLKLKRRKSNNQQSIPLWTVRKTGTLGNSKLYIKAGIILGEADWAVRETEEIIKPGTYHNVK